MADVVIENGEQLEAWLEDKPRLWAQVIALRCALRVVPIIAAADNKDKNSFQKKCTIALFRTLAIASSSIQFKYDVSDRSAANALYAVFAKEIDVYMTVNDSLNYITNAYLAAAYATYVSYQDQYITDAIYAAIHASEIFTNSDEKTHIWQAIQTDVLALEIGENPLSLSDAPIWHKKPTWFPYQYSELVDALLHYSDGFEIWRIWYKRRVYGDTGAFEGFDRKSDEEFYRFLVEQDNDWWKREPALVNADIKALVDSLRKTRETQPDPQTANAPNFGYGPSGRIGVDALAGNKELARDAGAQSRFNKLRQRLTNLVAALKGNNNAGVLAEIANDILDALGSAIEDTDPYLAVLDIESLRSALDIQQAYGENDDYRPLEGEQLRLAKNTIAAANLWVGSEEFLERIDATLPGPDHKRPLPESDDAIALADALKSDDLTEPSADKIIRKSAENIPETTDGEDRKTGLMVRGGLNLLRWSINAIVEHEGKVLAYAAGGATAGIFTSGFLATGGVALSAASFAFLLAKNIQKNEDIWRKWAQTARVTESNFDALMEKIRNLPLN